MKQTKFKLSHTILYAKGWYLKTDDIWGDLERVLLLDDYSAINRNLRDFPIDSLPIPPIFTSL